MAEKPEEITRLLRLAADGNQDATREAFRLLYDELRRIAEVQRRTMRPGETLRSTVLVHEAYLRLAEKEPADWKTRAHFFFAAARTMHDLLVEEARRKSSAKRGGGRAPVEITLDGLPSDAPTAGIVDLRRALRRLERQDPEGHQIVLLRYFAGLTVAEVANLLGASTATIERRWRFLRVWLAEDLESRADPSAASTLEADPSGRHDRDAGEERLHEP